jgi:hypothetical protein
VEFDRIAANNAVTVPLGVDLEQFHPRRRCENVRRQWAQPGQTLLVHWAGFRSRSTPIAASMPLPHFVIRESMRGW